MKVKYSEIQQYTTRFTKDAEYLYFMVSGERFYEWKRGSSTINIKLLADFSAPDMVCLSLSSRKGKPTIKDVKSRILSHINQ